MSPRCAKPWIASATLLFLLGAAAAGEEPPMEAPTPVALDQLLKLPTSLNYSVPSRGGASPSEWRERFAGLRSELASEEEALDTARSKLEEVAGTADAWQVGPAIPGADASDAPVDYQLRQRIRRHRAKLEELERSLRDLEVEADLADVPADWRE